MIGFFPDIYEDELLYSQLCRYYQRTGYSKYLSAIDDLFMRRTVHPVIEWVNEYTPDAMSHITKNTDFESVIRDHTMFPAYTRFLPKDRRKAALQSLLTCDGNYYNLIVNQNLKHKRFLRYCPVCAKEDRERLGETYWHREHQIIHIDICPKHRCFLENSGVPIGGKVTPGLFAAENEVPYSTEPEQCVNDFLLDFVRYVIEVFREPVEMENDILIGSFLRSKLDDKYLSESKMRVYVTKLYEDYCKFFLNICEPMRIDAFKKIYNNYSLDHYLIYQLAYFQGVNAKELSKHSASLVNTAMEEFYHELGLEFDIEYETVRNIGEAVIAKYRRLGKVSRKSGPKQREWAELDKKYLPTVKEIVDRILYAEKPERVSIRRVERELGIPAKQMQKLTKCRAYVLEHIETMNEFRARKVIWAVRQFQEEGRYMSKNTLNHFLNFSKNDIQSCFAYIDNQDVRNVIEGLL